MELLALGLFFPGGTGNRLNGLPVAERFSTKSEINHNGQGYLNFHGKWQF
jgi:hypothetical protein